MPAPGGSHRLQQAGTYLLSDNSGICGFIHPGSFTFIFFHYELSPAQRAVKSPIPLVGQGPLVTLCQGTQPESKHGVSYLS